MEVGRQAINRDITVVVGPFLMEGHRNKELGNVILMWTEVFGPEEERLNQKMGH